MHYLELEGKTVLVTGVANKKSVAYFVGKSLLDAGAVPVFSVRSEERRKSVSALFPGSEIYVCDFAHEGSIANLRSEVLKNRDSIYGIVHSIAFANYSSGPKPFHEVEPDDFLKSVNISVLSLTGLANAFKDNIEKNGSVVTISISTTTMASENYGFMGPVKAALDSSVCFLAKSFSRFSGVRFNSVRSGLLKTSASAGIPNYIESYIFAEKLTLRKRGLATQEVANTAMFLLSPKSSGINAQGIVVDAGMSVNYFDSEVVSRAAKTD